MSVSSVVLGLAFAWLLRGSTDANAKPTTLARANIVVPCVVETSGADLTFAPQSPRTRHANVKSKNSARNLILLVVLRF